MREFELKEYNVFEMFINQWVLAEAPEGEKPAVIVSGDRAASLGTGIALLAELKDLGVGRVSFQVSGTAEP